MKDNTSNPSQKLRRLTDSCITALDDLGLIAGKTPQRLQDEVFTPKKMRPLIEKILTLESSLSKSPYVNMVDVRRAQLSAIMINKGIQFLKLQYEFLEHDSPGLTKIILDQLSHAAGISNEIANKVELLNIRDVASKSKLEYLFNWKELTEKHEKLWSYLYGYLGEPFGITRIKRSPDDRKIKFDLISPYDIPLGTVKITLQGEGNKATLLVSQGSTTTEKELITRWENDELYVFKKISD